tara:strand:- start:22659 stop:22946 length:288 start_codon:yes stop_codon:yes gene_type:complete
MISAPDFPNTQLYIDGAWCGGRQGKLIEVFDPATGEVIGTVAHAMLEDLDLALEAVARGFKIWSATSALDRSRTMRLAAELLRTRAQKNRDSTDA